MTALERLLDLVVLLLSSRRPVPARAIFEAFPKDYGGSDDARERKLSRDKAELRALGIPIEFVTGDDAEETGYVIDRSAFYLPEVAFTPIERAALLAAGAAAMKGPLPLKNELAAALVKLRSSDARGIDRARPVLFVHTGESSPHAELLGEAVTTRRKVKLTYPPEPQPRIVRPYAIALRRGRLTVVGHCELRGAVRTFHADRMTSVARANPAEKKPAFEVPADFTIDDHLPRHPWQIRVHAPVEVRLSFAPELATIGPQTLGIRVGEPVPATNLDGLLAQVLALGEGVVVEGPPEARRRLRAMLTGLVDDAGLSAQIEEVA